MNAPEPLEWYLDGRVENGKVRVLYNLRRDYVL